MTLRTNWFYPFALLVAIILSVFGFVVAVWDTQCSSDAGRGGAAAVAWSFAILIVTRNMGDQVYSMLTFTIPKLHKHLREVGVDVTDLEKKLDTDRASALATKATIDGRDQRIQNYYLAAASVIGTIVWGFADIPARQLMAALKIAAKC